MNWYLMAFQKYAEFSGRSRRKEYWMFSLFNFIALVIAFVLDSVLGTSFGGLGYGLFYLAYILGVFIPSVAVSVRRLHDVSKSGWMILVSFIPLVGWIWMFILMVTDSTPGDNQYGPNPKETIAL